MMVAKAEEGSSGAMGEFFSADDECDDVYLDLDSFWSVMGPPEPTQGSVDDDLPFTNNIEGLEDPKVALSQRDDIPGFGVLSPSYNSEASDCRTGCSESFTESVANSVAPDGDRIEPSSQVNFAEDTCPGSVTDFTRVQNDGLPYTHADGGFQSSSSYYQNGSKKVLFEKLNHSDTFSFYGADHNINNLVSSECCQPNHEEDLFGYSRADTHSKNLYLENLIEQTDPRTPVLRMEDSYMDGDRTSQDASHTESSSYEVTGADIPEILSENGGLYLSSSDDPPGPLYSSGFQSLPSDDGRMIEIMDEWKTLDEDLISMMSYEHLLGNEGRQSNAKSGNSSTVCLSSNLGDADMHRLPNEPKYSYPNTMLNGFRKIENHMKVKNNIESVTSNDIVSRASEVIGDVISRTHYRGTGELPATEGVAWPSSNTSSLIYHKNFTAQPKDERKYMLSESNRNLFSLGMAGETPVKKSTIVAHNRRSVIGLSGQPGILPSSSIKAEVNCLKMENEVPRFNGYSLPNITYPGVQNNRFEQSIVNDDSDVCILEDMSAPARPNSTVMNAKLVATSQFSASRDPVSQVAMVQSKVKQNDERVIFRVALQDLTQPKSEATPPDGLLAVPLLKHQRIALHWMVNKETKSACCSGGILADDQGLGKTVSTIALILKERSPSSKAPKAIEEQIKTETLNLDEGEDGPSETYNLQERAEPCQIIDYSIHGGNTFLQAKGRPAAGTLIVCPTSVLRQWSEELHNKVTSIANLSVLVYHGSNRTKDPLELAKYDVVVTTYAIVTMEVPKQPVVDENDDLIGTPFQRRSSCKKRKLHETTSGKKSSGSKKSKKGIDNDLLETMSGPLAKVGWFRVVLDEAQSIKNHRTQVARACWGLRAKRRWCLSGTPIQNAIDDLYSYFRFLRHEPYAVFGTFCEQLKVPIHKNPKNGYKKLQAVLKTIMLRRTKGTVINGEPIINLPPKTIELKQVDFSKEEREFYHALEADSRAQFAEYAAKGTVKQNYVNILLMLLRLRQACDHPLLVKDCNSNSKMTSSIKMAKDLPREKQISLLNCLEGSLAICGICSDPPEDAVVTVCGHVFCNQCLCEHMIGDDSQCPTKNCKTYLTMSHVFSLTSLRIALSDQLTIANTPNCSDSELAQVSKPRSLSCPQDSSKIKAALELLLSLSKPEYFASRTSSSIYVSEDRNVCESVGENGMSDMNKYPNHSVKVMGEKAIVFSQWTRMLDLLEASLKDCSIQYRRLDGTMPVSARDRAVKDFNTLPQVSVMIMSLKAASLGLNMVAACQVLLLDLWWNPTTEDQAIDRAHRIGQTRPVSVFRLTVKDTVEDRILALQVCFL
ncbi:hypothetical protein ACJIZ3_013180 [Penstemon smallii]|uniref:Helicase-like transcription factor CHR28 n=1 Tax=Penstemon smallii TaxID=265156 RepID=A0ABD3UT60_9LAMI